MNTRKILTLALLLSFMSYTVETHASQTTLISGKTPIQNSILPIPYPSQTQSSSFQFNPHPFLNNENYWQKLFQKQADDIVAPLNHSLKALVVNTDDPNEHQFVWQDILKRAQNDTDAQETGLAGLYVGTGKVNGEIQPMCYILYRFDKVKAVQNQFIIPLSTAYNNQIAAAFLIGHEMGHCFDFMEQANAMQGQPSWDEQHAQHIGIAPSAFNRVFGKNAKINDDTYQSDFSILQSDLAQRQYQERIADIFGVFWAWTQGMPKAGIDIIRKTRDGLPQNSAHNTLNALKDLESFYEPVINTKGDLKTLWLIARQIQAQRGVTKAAMTWTPPPGSPENQEHSPIPNSGPILFGTSHPVSSFGQPNPSSNSSQGIKNFEDLPRFGQ